MPKRKTTEEFIKEAREIHGDKYDYSKVQYINTYTPITIICPIHGEFDQTPREHLHGHGCYKCGKGKYREDTNDFIKKAEKIYGNTYTYLKTEYVNFHTKVCITCPKHGDFFKTPAKFLSSKQGCPKCSKKIKTKNNTEKKITTEQFILKARSIHGWKYDYSKVNYINNHTKVCIICPKHGEFWQTPINHLSGNGCRKCSDERHKHNTNWFVSESKRIWNDKYFYEKSNYTGINKQIIVTCPKHGDFTTTPRWFLAKDSHRRACLQCAIENRTKTTEEFIKEAIEMYGDKYDYSNVIYKHGNKKVDIICPKHGVFSTIPNNFLSGHGCPYCSAEENVKETKLFTNLSSRFPELNFKHLYHNSKILGRQEIDIFNEKYKIGIEYQGDQHFQPVNFFGGENSFKKISYLDNEKIDKCNKNQITLLHFTYNKNYKKDNIKYDVYVDENDLFEKIEELINNGAV